jgi:hypothetical protein
MSILNIEMENIWLYNESPKLNTCFFTHVRYILNTIYDFYSNPQIDPFLQFKKVISFASLNVIVI